MKEILNINEPVIKEKHIIYAKPDMKRNKSPDNSCKNSLNLVNDVKNSKKNNNINIKINSGNQIINVNAINVNIDTGEKKEKNKNMEMKDKDNNDNFSANEDLNILQINEEMNLNDKKLNFENDKINDDSIETIPFEEKSMTNMSFKDDFKELLNKNYEFKYQINNLNLKTDENNEIFSNSGAKKKFANNLNKNSNIKNNQEMKMYNKKLLINEKNISNNKHNNKENELNSINKDENQEKKKI